MSELIRMSEPVISSNEKRYVCEAIDSGWVTSSGPFVERFENAFKSWLGTRHALTVSSGTTALHLTLAALGIGPGDTVLVPAIAMAAPVFAVCYCGAEPVPVDVDSNWNLDAAQLSSQCRRNTKAILVVHNYGVASNLREIMDFADREGLVVIEDAAEAMGTHIGGKFLGTFARASCFSLYGNKLVTSGEGGIVVTNDDDLFQRLVTMRSMCFGNNPRDRFIHEQIGFSYRMSNLQAAFALAQLERVDEFIASRKRVSSLYDSMLGEIPNVTIRQPRLPDGYVPWVYPISVGDNCDVDVLQQALSAKRVESRRVFLPVASQPFMRRFDCNCRYPAAEAAWKCGLLLPLYANMPDAAVSRVVKELQYALEVNKNGKD